MKVRVTRSGVYAKDEGGKEVPLDIGTEMEVEGDTIPPSLLNKCVPVGGAKKAAINPAKDGGAKQVKDPAKDAKD